MGQQGDRRGLVRSAAVAGGSAALLFGLYLLLMYPPPVVELFVGGGAAGIAAVGGAVAYSTLWPGYQVDHEIGADMVRLPVQVLRDLASVAGVLIAALVGRRRLAGRTHWLPFAADGAEKLVRGRRAATAVLQSVAPNTVVVGFDAAGEQMLVHQLRSDPDGERAP